MEIKQFRASILIIIILSVLGCNRNIGEKNQSTISVFGTGTVMVKPDMIQMNIILRNIAQTTRLAQVEVGNMVKQVLEILRDSDIDDKNITTASLTFNSEYEYGTGRRVLIGQKAEQTITFSIDGIQDNNEKVSQIIDRFIQINGIELNNINFNVKDNTEYFIQSRELAYQKAVEKATQYADLSGLTVIKVLSISEEGTQQFLPITNRMITQSNYLMSESVDTGSTILPTGELEISTRIFVVFLLK